MRPAEGTSRGLDPRGFDPGELIGTEPASQRRRSGRRRRHRNRPYRPSRGIGPEPVEVRQVVAAGEEALGERHHELPGGQAPVALFDRTDEPVDRLDHPEGPDRLSDTHRSRVARQRSVIGPHHHTRPVVL